MTFNKFLSIFVIGLSVFLSSIVSIYAEPLAQWNFAGADGTQVDASAENVAKGISVSPITRGEGFSPGKSSAFTENGLAMFSVPEVNSLEEAIEKAAYFEITLTPEPSMAVTVDSISFASKRASKHSGPNLMVVRSSLDDFSSDVAGPLETLPQEVPEGGDIELSFGGGLSALTEPVTLRFYGFGRKQNDNPVGGIWVIGNNSVTNGVTLNGSVSKK